MLTLISSAFSMSASSSSIYAPVWLRPNIYAEFAFDEGSLMFLNSSRPSGIDVLNFIDGSYRWECIELNETMSKLKLTLRFVEIERNGRASEQNATLEINTYVFVDIFSRAIYLENGTSIGTTNLWLPANPSAEDEIVLWDLPPDRVAFKIDENSNFKVETPQGLQRGFSIHRMGQVGNRNKAFTVTCDFDTGVMVDGLKEDITLSALGVRNLFQKGRSVFVATNIDLGPSETPLDNRLIFTIIAIPIAFLVIFLAVYKRLRKKRR
jgi:hypothetical protein